MYTVSPSLAQYYAELDPAKRLELLNASDAEEFVHTLYHERYSDHEGKGRKNIDWWLWRCICLQLLYGRGGFFKRFRDREINTILDELFMNDPDESHVPYLYHEYRNVCRRYLSTCRSGNYASRFMGFRQASDEEKVLKACSDVWEMSAGIARIFGQHEKMRVWCGAFRDELMEYDSVCREEYDRLNKQ
ncbi:MAG: hypothetical protein IJT02_04345 [Synergistaceae bacterium]|nr:hypothetical protein [Synergistaceae bacterium]